MIKDYKSRVAVITGATRGIGFALAEKCSNEGMNVVISDISLSRKN